MVNESTIRCDLSFVFRRNTALAGERLCVRLIEAAHLYARNAGACWTARALIAFRMTLSDAEPSHEQSVLGGIE